MSAQRKDVQSTGRAPHWMNAHGIQFDRRITVTKEQLEAMQRPGEELKVQLWATGILHSPGYQGELAKTSVPQKGGGYQVVDLTPALISHELATVALKFFDREGIDTSELLKHLPAKLKGRFPEPAKDAATKRKLKILVLRWPKQKLRAAMEQLEDEGLMERRTVNGRPLRDLSKEELRCLPSGNIRMFFYLEPKAAKLEVVESEWVNTLNALNPDQNKNKTGSPAKATSFPSVRRILDLFGVLEHVGRQRITEAEYQKKVVSAYEEAKTIFLSRLELDEVALPGLPKVASAGLREVALPGSRIEPKRRTIYKESQPSVGRSVSSIPVKGPEPEPPTDRPKEELQGNPFKTQIREWMSAHISIPGWDLEEPELEQVAATIQTEAHFKQFQEAALLQKHPRGWRVFVKIAKHCEEQHGRYATAAPRSEKEDPLLQRLKKEAEERKSWPTS